ncbi:MAG: TIM barrel protein [Candidatus Micrarchaeia archaeon]|jgi:deoxyribonuclease-4
MGSEIRFGTSGNPPNFFESKWGKDRKNALDWINSIGLNAYEYTMTHGARIREEKALHLKKKAKEFDIKLSVHGPYYIVLTSDKKRVYDNSINELLKTMRLSSLMGAEKVIFHPGFKTIGHFESLKQCITGLKKVIKEYGNNDIKVFPETTGKICQLGDLEDIITICEKTECIPCIDFGHLHARNLGSLKSKEDIKEVLIKIENRLGKKILKNLHCHFYPIEYTDKGEKVHRAVFEKDFYPKFEHFAPLIKEFNMAPTLISESKNSQDLGALYMKKVLEKIL